MPDQPISTNERSVDELSVANRSFSLKKRPAILGILTFTILACLTGLLVYQRFLIREENRREQTRDAVRAAKERLQDLLIQGESATKTLALFIQPDGSVKDFNIISSQILMANPSIDALELAPGGVVRYVYPLKGNEPVLGYDVLQDTLRNKEAFRAISNKDIFFAGPFSLKQGGIGVIGRLPIMRDNKFWGFSGVLIRISTLLKSAGIDSGSKSNYYFQLSKINPNTAVEEFFVPQRAGLSLKHDTYFDIPNAGWRLSAIPGDENKLPITIVWLAILGLLFSVTGAWLVYVISKRPEKLKALVKKRTRELEESETKYRLLIEQASDGIVITDLSGIITEVNRSICIMSGYTPEEMTGRHVNDFMPEPALQAVPPLIADLKEGKTLQYERRLEKKDGSLVNVEVNSKIARGNSLIGFVRDITERKKAEAALRKSNERFELIAKATNDAIWDYDFVKDETLGNENLYNFYGFAPDDHKINRDAFLQRLHPDDRERVGKNILKAFEEKAVSITNEFRFRIADDSYRHIWDRAYIRYDDQHQPERMLGVMQDITTRIVNRQTLIKEKELSDSVINNLPGIFYLFNKQGKFLRWNKNFETVTGYSSEEINELQPIDFFDGLEKELLAEKIENVFATGEDNVVADLFIKNGQKIPYYFSGIRVDYENITCLMGFGLDFSDKARSEKFLKESEQKFRGLVEQASDGIAILSATGELQYVSPSIQRILGYTEEEIIRLGVIDLAHPDDIDAIIKVFEEVMQQPGIPVKAPIGKVLHKDGSWRSMEFVFTNMFHVPSINGIVENFRDITEKLEADRKIIAEKFLSDSIINSLPGIFYLYDQTGRFIRWNRNFETITGYSAEEIRHMHPLDFYDDDIKPAVARRISDVLRKKMPSVEFALLTRSGRKIPFFYNSLSINYEGLLCVAGMGFDIAEKKRIEQELVISNEHLEQKAAELKESNDELERFAYIVSHDLQEPLRMVSSFLKLLEQRYKTKLDETAEKYIFFAVDGAERMKALIMDLLEYSRTGTNTDAPQNINMNEIMADVLNLFADSIKEKNAFVEVGSLPELPAVSKTQMFQLMQNLLSNALKYHGQERPVIKIQAQEEQDRWVFSVQDNGIGIDPKFADRIFIVFQRLHNKTEYSGTGIGLSICKKIVEKYGGKIWVESSVGNGSIFYFSVPKNNFRSAKKMDQPMLIND